VDEMLDRVRELLPGAEEKKMFGGVGFMVDGSLACTVSPRGLLVRVDRDEQDNLVEHAGVAPMVMGGRRSRTWVSVEPAVLGEGAALAAWVDRGAAAARAAD
jgi:TfoX/Sxy family transcriptional regulator of competence genes